MKDIESLSSSDEMSAKEAFDNLYDPIQSELTKYLVSKISNPQDREEIIANSCIRIWNVRRKFKAESVGAWFLHIRRICWWAAIDHLRTKQEHDAFEDHGKQDESFEEATSASAKARRRLHNLADQVWLGWDASVSPLDRKRRVLAAQLFYLHDRKWSEIACVVRLRPERDRELFDDWISQKPTLLHLSFKEFHASNQELCEILLGKRPVMSASAEHRYRPVNWTPEEIEFVRYRFQYGVEPAHFSEEFAQRVTEACLKLFPFIDRFERVEKKIMRPLDQNSLLSSVGLWKRIVFHYHAVNDIKYKHIQERVEPIANRGGQKMNENTMQAWLSSGRLAKLLKDAK
ncbi:MAG TPA: hypothetical protein VK171_10970 [Fimbriimonas sp.]|nr:hypothetical protein [Fimbriimonas sp.]